MPRRITLFVFFLAGLSALIYEITWVRQATLVFGVSIFAYAAVLTAYMGGMALGGYAIGRWADRTGHPGRMLAVLQVGLAVLGFLALPFLNGLTGVYGGLARSLNLENKTTLTLLRLCLALLPLTPPALFIGAAFPVMARIVARADGKVGGDLGRMYAANTFGSVVGCLLAALVLIRAFGVSGTLFVAVALNVMTALLAWFTCDHGRAGLLYDSNPAAATTGTSAIQQPPTQGLSPGALRFVIIAYAVSGFVSLAYEVAWGRLISLYVVGNVFSFSLMLAVYLTGLVVGAMISSAWIRKRGATLSLFGRLEMVIGLLAVLSLFVFPRLSEMKINDLFGGYNMGTDILFESLLSFITLFPVTCAIGAVFPVVVSLYSGEQADRVGRKIARISAFNTAGSIAGSLLAGFVIIPLLGLQRSVVVLAMINGAIGLAALWMVPSPSIGRRILGGRILGGRILGGRILGGRILGGRILGGRILGGRILGTVPLALAVIAALLLPTPRYLGYWENMADRLLFYREGVETTVAVFDRGRDNPKFSTVNGRIEVPTDPVSMRIFHLLGHLPPLLKPDAENALVLSFGNGIATGTMATHPVPRIDVVDLSAEMIQAARTVYTTENRGVADDPRVTVHIEDARNYLLQTGETYDIISNDATHPSNSCSWVLYTVEFYRHVRAHLAADGVFVQWLPCHSITLADYKMILRTFQSVFGNATLWYTGGTHSMLLATPAPLTSDTLAAKLRAGALSGEVLQELGDANRISGYWAFDAGSMREFAGPGTVVRDATAFFVADEGHETSDLINILQVATMEAKP